MAHIQHFSHRHLLYKNKWWSALISCGICNQPMDKSEVHYDCVNCYSCTIHKACAELPEHINNSLHDTHSLSLLKRSSLETSIRCFYCDKSFGNEFAYTCKECAFYVHAKCGVISQTTMACDDHGVIQFSCHQHPMPLVVEHEDGEDIILGKKCIACQLPCSYPAYSCTIHSCLNFFHKSCVDKLSQKIQHPFHSHKSLILQISKLQSCDLCYKKDCRLVFSCHEIGCTFKVCTECAFLDSIIVRCRSHDHLLCLVEGAYFDNIKCDACQKSYKELNNHATSEIHLTRSFLFRCMECDFNLHFICGPLPSTIKFNYHIHSLTLLDPIYEDNCHEYYCDVCEEERNPDFRVYSCSNCRYEAHIHCLIHQIMKLMKGGNDISNDVELWALGENRWNWTIAIGEKNYNNTHKVTLGDLMSCLTQQENEILLHPWMITLIQSFNHRIFKHDNYKNANSRFHQLGRSIEDFETITEFFQKFDSLAKGFDNEILWYAREDGISKVEDKYLRQEVMEVDGKYKVPKTLAPILKTLLDNYCGGGDLGGRSWLSPAMKSVCATILLILIDKMCRTKIEDVTWDELKEWYFHLYCIYKIAEFKVCGYLLDDLTKKFIRDYWSFKAIRCKQDSKNQINTKIEYLKVELKRWEENLDKLEKIDMNGFLRTYALPLKKMIDDDMDYSENIAWHLKHKTVGDRVFENLDEKLG
ncbi:uncharacterized protein LOC133781826 [Humulus lupulus]|uniref:uncharacterized protein LOC133781826 n=1 Tax=Humulus lupulus TaxID=3486 RepID=UPI002B40DF11|nr:uncharacterized protein LOC133781826 [Humulus lupulus]